MIVEVGEHVAIFTSKKAKMYLVKSDTTNGILLTPVNIKDKTISLTKFPICVRMNRFDLITKEPI